MSKLKLFLTLTLTIFLTITINAQVENTKLTIIVKNQLDEVIPDAEIILNDSTQTDFVRKTNKQGIATFPKIKEGEYKLSIKAAGFSDYINEKLIVNRDTKSINISLEVRAELANVVIDNKETLSTDDLNDSRVISEEAIKKLPDDPKQLERYLKSLGGTSEDGEKLPITVDGAENGKIPPKSAIQMIRVNRSVFSAQYDRPVGGGIEIFTKQSVEKFSGGFGGNFSDSRFNAKDPFISQKLPQQSKSFNAELTGPINKNNSFGIWFYTNIENSSEAINATILNSAFQPTSYQDVFKSPNRYYGVGGNLNSELNKKNKLRISYNLELNRNNGGAGGFSLPSKATNSKSLFQFININESFIVNENLVNQTNFNGSLSKYSNLGLNNDVAISVLESFEGGGSQNNSKNTNGNFDFSNGTTWQKNNYNTAFGFRIRGRYINQDSRYNYGGTYVFSGKTAPMLDATNNIVYDNSGNPVLTEITSLESYRRTLLFKQLGYSNSQIRQFGGGASQFSIAGGNSQLSVSQYEIGFYQQNSYKLRENLAVSFGVRYENQTNISSNTNFAPRIGLVWSPKVNPKSDPKKVPLWRLPKITLGYGVFYKRYELYSFLNIRDSVGNERQQYLITDPNILDIFPNVPSVASLQALSLAKTQRFLDENLQTPFQHIFRFGTEKQLPYGFSLSNSLTYTKLAKQLFTYNINAPLAGTYSPSIANSGIRPFGGSGNIYKTFSNGKGESLAFTASLTLPQKIVQGNIFYSFTKAKNNVVRGSGQPNDPYNFSQEYGFTDNDGVHRVRGDLSYTLPLKISAGLDFSFTSGRRFNITTGRDTNGDGFFTERPAFATDLSTPNLIKTPYGVLDPNPTNGANIIPRNLAKGSSTITSDLNLSRSFGFINDAKTKESKYNLGISVSINNVFNIINKGNPIGNMSSPYFLKTPSASQGTFFEVTDGTYFWGGETASRSFSFGINFSF